jgi:hypothetical protein
MWWTPHGERVLRGAEWELFRAGLDTLWDWVENPVADPDISDTGTPAFDRLQIGQRLALLASVGTASSEEGVSRPRLTVNIESAVAAVFGQIASEVEKEIDLSRDPDRFPSEVEKEIDLSRDLDWLANPDEPEDATRWRRLVLAAYREAMLQDEAEALAGSKDEAGRPQEIPAWVGTEDPEVFWGSQDEAGPQEDAADGEEGFDDEEDSDRPWSPPDATSEVAEDWEFLIDYLANRILWNDRDYEAGDLFLDDDPARARALMELMGIERGYYTDIASDPTEKQLELVRRTLRSLCGRPDPE